jgi:hypothetical protein
MRTLPALLHAMRTRRTRRIDLDEADRLAAGDPPMPAQAGLGTLLDALRAPATTGELSAEKTTVAAFTAHRKRAARAARRRSPTRAVLAPAMTALALLAFGGTALAARTGNLPDGAQQHAHRLFSALGVPAPRTGPHHPSPSPSDSPAPVELAWCSDWQPGGPSLSTENHRKLRAAAGSEEHIPDYCDRLRRSATVKPPSAVTASPGGTPSAPNTGGPPSRTAGPSGAGSPSPAGAGIPSQTPSPTTAHPKGKGATKNDAASKTKPVPPGKAAGKGKARGKGKSHP